MKGRIGAFDRPGGSGRGLLAGEGHQLGRGHVGDEDAPAYDAGTEVNDETCASIPGPSYVECSGPGGGGAPAGGEEGFVRIHEGLHGVGDFNAATRDWRNPVAKISVRRVR